MSIDKKDLSKQMVVIITYHTNTALPLSEFTRVMCYDSIYNVSNTLHMSAYSFNTKNLIVTKTINSLFCLQNIN